MEEVYVGIWDEWDNHLGLKGVLPRFYFQEAPAHPDSPLPYGVYWSVAQARLDTFDSNSEEYLIQIDSYDNAFEATDIMAIQAQVHLCFDWTALAVAGWNHIYMRRVSTLLQREDDCWHGIDTYQLEVQS